MTGLCGRRCGCCEEGKEVNKGLEGGKLIAKNRSAVRKERGTSDECVWVTVWVL